MRKMLLMSVALLGLAGPVFAQGRDSSTFSPPAPSSSVGMPQPSNSLPAGGGTATYDRAGDAIGGQAPGSSRGMSGMRPMRGQQRETTSEGMTGEGGPAMPMRRSERGQRAATGDGMGAGMTGAYDGGRGVPMSPRASNTTPADTRSEIAPRLPAPDAGAGTPEAFLAAAQRALAAGRTGQAQEALERAETRLLTRSVEASAAGTADASPMVTQIGEARRALGRRDIAGARQAINMAMSSGSGAGAMGTSGDSMPMRSGMGNMPMGAPR